MLIFVSCMKMQRLSHDAHIAREQHLTGILKRSHSLHLTAGARCFKVLSFGRTRLQRGAARRWSDLMLCRR